MDEKLAHIVEILSPHFLLSSAQKVLEFLIRVFEVHAHLKETLLLALLPFFETGPFTRLAQLLNLKNDDYFSFVYEPTHKGEKLNVKLLLKGLARNGCAAFAKLATFTLQMLQRSQSQIHQKFLGYLMVELIKMNPGDQQTLLTVLPFISEGFTQSSEFKASCLAAMAEICSRKSLSQQYVRAFISLIVLNLEKDLNLDEF